MLPDESRYRVLRADDPRTQWRAGQVRPEPALAADTPGLREEMALARGCESFFYVVDPARLLGDHRLRRFRGWGGPTGFPVALVRELAEGLTLEHFIVLAQEQTLGIPGAYFLDWPERQPAEQLALGVRPANLPPHNATAFAINPIGER